MSTFEYVNIYYICNYLIISYHTNNITAIIYNRVINLSGCMFYSFSVWVFLTLDPLEKCVVHSQGLAKIAWDYVSYH